MTQRVPPPLAPGAALKAATTVSHRPALGLVLGLGLALLGGCGEGTPSGDAASVPPAPASTPVAPTPASAPPPVAAPDPRLERLPAAYADSNIAAGKRTFAQCRSCHLVAGDRHSLGPNLSGLFGRQVATAAGFTTYSDALKAADFVWTPELLEQWLADPKGFLPGNAMSFLGVRDEAARHDLIAYLMLETGALDEPAPEPATEPAP